MSAESPTITAVNAGQTPTDHFTVRCRSWLLTATSAHAEVLSYLVVELLKGHCATHAVVLQHGSTVHVEECWCAMQSTLACMIGGYNLLHHVQL